MEATPTGRFFALGLDGHEQEARARQDYRAFALAHRRRLAQACLYLVVMFTVE